jgi:hypothetical protein
VKNKVQKLTSEEYKKAKENGDLPKSQKVQL